MNSLFEEEPVPGIRASASAQPEGARGKLGPGSGDDCLRWLTDHAVGKEAQAHGPESPGVDAYEDRVRKAWSGSEKAPDADCARAPSVIGLRDSSHPTRSAATYTVGGSMMLRFSECCTGKRSSVPESFRGGCSFGGQHAGSLPLAVARTLSRFGAKL